MLLKQFVMSTYAFRQIECAAKSAGFYVGVSDDGASLLFKPVSDSYSLPTLECTAQVKTDDMSLHTHLSYHTAVEFPSYDSQKCSYSDELEMRLNNWRYTAELVTLLNQTIIEIEDEVYFDERNNILQQAIKEDEESVQSETADLVDNQSYD